MKSTSRSFKVFQVFNVVAFFAMVAVNAMASILPINGVTTAQVSDALPNLFTPAGLTFSIWGVIYLLLFVFVLYQTGLLHGPKKDSLDAAQRVGPFFIISSFFNIAWIFCWHYGLVVLSTVCMFGLLVSLIVVFLRIMSESMSLTERVLVKLPFSVYFGWITVAAIANVSAMLVYLGIEPFGMAAQVSTVAIIVAGVAVGLSVVLSMRAPAFGLTMTWAFLGIVIKHIGSFGFVEMYPGVIVAAALAATTLLTASLVVMIRKQNTDSAVAAESPLS